MPKIRRVQLNERERKFVNEYMLDGNAARAAREAGYSESTASTKAVQILKRPAVAKLIRTRRAKAQEHLKLSEAEVLRHLYYLATRTSDDFVDEQGRLLPLQKLNRRAAACVDGIKQTEYYDRDGNLDRVETTLKLSPKASGVDMALKHKGLFAPEKHENNVHVTIDWDRLAEPPDIIDVEADPIERKISSVKALPAPPDPELRYTLGELIGDESAQSQ